MADGHTTDRWNHTAELLATLRNCFSAEGGFKASDFHPDTMPRQEQPVSNFDARYYAISLCGERALKMFAEHDRKLARHTLREPSE